LQSQLGLNAMKTFFLFSFILLLSFSPVLGDTSDSFEKQPDKPVDLAQDKNLYVVGYAHLDTQWRWTYPYVIQNFIRNTMEQNFPLIEKYPNYVFNFTGSRRYEFMKEYYPDDYAKVKQYVAQGRWFPAGSSVDENDANIPSLESITRHLLYGNRFFQHEFGIQSDEYMLPDCFGFPASLPEILAHGGIKGFSTQKLTWGSAIGIPFKIGRWIGPDGSSIVAALDPGGYGSAVNEDLSQNEVWLKRINATGDASGVYADYHYYGTGDRGGAPGQDSVQWIERSVAGNGPVRVISSRSDQMFKDISPEQAAKLPSYKGELLLVNHSAGSISSEAYMKRWNRKNEQLANAAESAATAASWLGAFAYPHDALYAAWDLVLGSQMHDIMPGTSLPAAYEYAWNDEVLALNQFASITEQATSAILSTLDTRAIGVPVAVYNPLPIDREDPVEATIPLKGNAPDAVTAYDPQGQPVPTQILSRDGTALRVLFIAKVPSTGYAVYDLRPGTSGTSPSALSVNANSIENARYRVTLDANGDVASVFDKKLKQELLSAPAQFSFHTENPSAFPAWNMDWNDRQKPARSFVGGPTNIRIVENGPARVALEVERTAENSTVIEQIRLAAGSAGDRIEFLDRLDWRSFQASFKADFHFTASNPEASFDDKVGVVQRKNDNSSCFEMPQQQWEDLTNTDGSYGVALLNDSKYGSDKPDDQTLRLTLLYTPGTRAGYQDQGTQDQGRHEILYALAGHHGDWTEGMIPWQAARLNQPLRAFLPDAHSGPLGKMFSLLSVSSNQVQVVAVKKAEDSNEIIVRLKELTGKPASGLSLSFPAPITAALEVDAQERSIGKAEVTNGALAFDMKAFGLRAFALQLAPAPTAIAPIASQSVSLPFDTVAVCARAQRADGKMDSNGGSYPAELFPTRLTRGGVDFILGPTSTGEKNALEANGQNLDLPGGDFNRIHILAAADGDSSERIKIGDVDQPFVVPNWTSFVGQWDTRLWNKPIPEITYDDPSYKTVGLVPGYIKRTPVAWYATHHNTPQGDAYYHYSYLFELSYDLPIAAKTLTLPQNSKIRIFAVSVSKEPSSAPPAAPLYDTLADHQPGGQPLIPQAGQTFHEPTEITLLPPLYHQPDTLHYTLDGSDPTAASPVYDAPFVAFDTVNVATRQIDAEGHAGPIVRGIITIQDQTLPQLTSVLADMQPNVIRLNFSKPIDPAMASDMKNYTVQPSLEVSTIAPSADGRGVAITFAQPLEQGTDYTISVSGLKDTTHYKNTIVPTTQPFNAQNIVYTLKNAKLPNESVDTSVPGLPMQKSDAWTMNVLVHPDAKPEDRSVIVGFGHSRDSSDSGSSRFFAFFEDGIRFWTSNRDVRSNSPLEVGRWQMLTATYDGKTLILYKDAEPIAKQDVELATDSDASVHVGISDPWDHQRQFHGDIQEFTLRRIALTGDQVKRLFDQTKPSE
jgi:alpha-mannosidase